MRSVRTNKVSFLGSSRPFLWWYRRIIKIAFLICSSLFCRSHCSFYTFSWRYIFSGGLLQWWFRIIFVVEAEYLFGLSGVLVKYFLSFVFRDDRSLSKLCIGHVPQINFLNLFTQDFIIATRNIPQKSHSIKSQLIFTLNLM
jgi:hypothetical protein